VIEDKSTRYHRRRRQAGLAGSAISAAVLLALVVSGASTAWADGLAAIGGWTSGAPEPAVAALYALVLSLLLSLLDLPLAAYCGHVLERRYGLTTERWGAWGRDHAKAVALGAAVSAGAAAVVYALMRAWPGSWWLGVAVVFGLVSIVLTGIAPVVVLPLFHRVVPLRHDALERRLVSLAERAGTPVVGAFEWGLGPHTRRANAALAGLGRTRRILVSDTLLASCSEDEIAVVLAHELSHHVHHDLWRALALQALLLALGGLAVHLALAGLAGVAGLRSPADPAGLPLLGLLAGAWSRLVAPIGHAVSRAHERRADRFALDLTGDPAAFVSAMKRLGQQNLAEERPSPLVRALFLSHPPLRDRLAAAQAWAATVTPPSRRRAMVSAED
jgi:STE24 endopeptidase